MTKCNPINIFKILILKGGILSGISNLRFLVSAGLVIRFTSVDCERSFLDLNWIKSKERSKTGQDLLKNLMILYSMNKEEMRGLKKEKLREISKQLAHKVWDREGYKRDSYYENDFIIWLHDQNIFDFVYNISCHTHVLWFLRLFNFYWLFYIRCRKFWEFEI